MSETVSITERIVQYLDLKKVTKQAFAEDSEYGKPFDKGLLQKTIKNKGTIGTYVVEKFLRRFPEVNPYWLILGQGDIFNESRYDEPVKIMPLDTWEELKYNNRQFAKTKESDAFDKSELYKIISYFTGSAVSPHKT